MNNTKFSFDVEKRWIPGLELLRTSAVFLVLLGHGKTLLNSTGQEIFKQWLPMPAAWGVELFFSLSGFLIGRQWINLILHGSSNPVKGLKYFIQRRWLRTIPTYWIVLTLFLLINITTLSPPFIGAYLTNLTLTNWAIGIPYALPVSWTLAIEEFGYIIIGGSILVFHGKKQKWQFVFATLMILVGIVTRLAYIQAGHWQDLTNNPLTRLDALGYGLFLAILMNSRSIVHLSRTLWERPALPILLIVGLIGFQHWRMDILVNGQTTNKLDAIFYSTLGLPALGIISSCCIIMVAGWNSTGFKLIDHAIKRLALTSYSVYLIHIPLRTMLQNNINTQTEPEGIFLFVGFLVGSILIGDLIYRLIEKPFIVLKDRIKNL